MKLYLVLLFMILSNLSVKAQVSKPILTSRWFHPKDNLDTLNTMEMIKTFKPARIDWTYCDDDKVLQLYRNLGLSYSLAINPQTSDSLGYTTTKTRIITAAGQPYVASWMNWKMKAPYWGCVNNPVFKKVFYNKTVQLIDLKPYAILVDDALFNIQLQKEKTDLVGCFCHYCIDSFYNHISKTGSNDYLSRNDLLPEISKYIESDKKDAISQTISRTINLYKETQNESVIAFLINWKSRILDYAPTIKILTNNNNGSWNSVHRIFDGGIAELQTKNLNISFLDSVFAVADKLKKTQNFTLVSSDKYAQNYLIAYLYSRQRDYFIPWDLYVPNPNSKINRYYTDPFELRTFLELLKLQRTTIESAPTLDILNNNNWYYIKKSNEYASIILNESPLRPQNRKLFLSTFVIMGLLISSIVSFILNKISNANSTKKYYPYLSV